MDNVRIYSLKNEDGVLLPYFMTSTNDKDVSKFALDYYEKTIKEIKDKQEQVNMLEQFRKMSFVCIAEVDLVSGHVEEKSDVLFLLTDFMKDIKPDVEIKEGKDGQMYVEMADNVRE